MSVVILTHDEELNLPACLASVAGWAEEIVVVDSGSTDRTREIAEQAGARVVTHPFSTHARQWRWALERLELGCPWVLGLDADQSLTAEARREIAERLAGETGVSGYYISRRQVFRGRWIRHGGYYPKYLLKLFRRSDVEVGDDLVDHRFSVRGRVERLRTDLIERNQKEERIGFWIEKHNRYAALQAEEELPSRLGAASVTGAPRFFGNADERTLFLKRIWRRLPLYFRPFLYFSYRYVLRLGFLDGKQGFVFHFLQAFWYRLLVDIKLEELISESAVPGPHRAAERPASLAGASSGTEKP